jgi:hypothetical protein
MENAHLSIVRLAEPVLHASENVVDVNYTVMVRDKASGVVEEIRETHPMRYFFSPEIEAFANASGFELLHSEEWMTRKRPGLDTWGVVFVLRARGGDRRSEDGCQTSEVGSQRSEAGGRKSGVRGMTS